MSYTYSVNMFIIFQPVSWDDTRHLVSVLKGSWIFRGQSDQSWGLTSSLERAIGQTNNEIRNRVENKEKSILREFQRRAHHYISSPPSYANKLEWLALFQHYGGVTRLLDFSHSFYVATFFAVENTIGTYTDAAIWAINLNNIHKVIKDKIDKKKRELLKNDTEQEYVSLAESILEDGIENKLVFGVEPERMNERLAIQQGIFLFPCNIAASLEENLAGNFDKSEEIFRKTPVITYDPNTMTSQLLESAFKEATVVKIIIPSYMKEDIIRDLWKMNVNTATLFPGIDGYARSLSFHLID